MGKLLLIAGENNSGKSRFAERLIAKTQGQRFYIATMRPQTAENYARINKHLAQRKELNFQTLERPLRVGDAELCADCVALLEDVSNLWSNVRFETNGSVEEVWADICALRENCALLVAVTISGLRAEAYSGETADYICGLNQLNKLLADHADGVVSMQSGEVRWEKGEIDAFL